MTNTFVKINTSCFSSVSAWLLLLDDAFNCGKLMTSSASSDAALCFPQTKYEETINLEDPSQEVIGMACAPSQLGFKNRSTINWKSAIEDKASDGHANVLKAMHKVWNLRHLVCLNQTINWKMNGLFDLVLLADTCTSAIAFDAAFADWCWVKAMFPNFFEELFAMSQWEQTPQFNSTPIARKDEKRTRQACVLV